MGRYKISIKDKDGNFKKLWQENTLGRLLDVKIPGITGSYTTEYRTPNHIVDAGLNGLAKLAVEKGTQDDFDCIALGTSDASPGVDDQTTLEAEITETTHEGRGLSRTQASTINVATNKATLEEEFTVTETTTPTGNIPIKEVGIFSQDTEGGTMLSRTVITTKNVDTDDKITVTYELTLSRT